MKDKFIVISEIMEVITKFNAKEKDKKKKIIVEVATSFKQPEWINLTVNTEIPFHEDGLWYFKNLQMTSLKEVEAILERIRKYVEVQSDVQMDKK